MSGWCYFEVNHVWYKWIYWLGKWKKYKYRVDYLFDDFYDCVIKGKEYREHDLLKLLDKYTINDESKRFYKTKKGTKVYRARVVNDFDYQNFYEYDIESEYIHGYNDLNSREAPIGIYFQATWRRHQL